MLRVFTKQTLAHRSTSLGLSRAFSVSFVPRVRELYIGGLPSEPEKTVAQAQLQQVVDGLGKFGTVVSARRSQSHLFIYIVLLTTHCSSLGIHGKTGAYASSATIVFSSSAEASKAANDSPALAIEGFSQPAKVEMAKGADAGHSRKRVVPQYCKSIQYDGLAGRSVLEKFLKTYEADIETINESKNLSFSIYYAAHPPSSATCREKPIPCHAWRNPKQWLHRSQKRSQCHGDNGLPC